MDDDPLRVLFDSITLLILIAFFIGLGAWMAWMWG